MTFSIIACNPETSKIGVAVSTANLAVGAVGYQLKSGVGVVVTQSDPHPILGNKAIRLMQEGLSPGDVLTSLLKLDKYRDRRQIALVNIHGEGAAWTGQECVQWAAHHVREDFVVSGNMLVSDDTLSAMITTYLSDQFDNFSNHLLLSLQAGQEAGGDKRGRQSAALCVFSTEEYADVDLRVDDHGSPINELVRLFNESEKSYYQDFRRQIPTHKHPSGVYDR